MREYIKPIFGCVRVSFQMSWTSTMSSGYSSLEEDSEEYFFTARTSLFKKPSGKPTNLKVIYIYLTLYQFIYLFTYLLVCLFWKLSCHIVFLEKKNIHKSSLI